MKKKIFLQLFLLLTVLIISITFFKIYFFKTPIASVEINQTPKKKFDKKVSNLMTDIKYEYNDKDNNSYIISSKKGKLNTDEPNIVLMENVVAIIKLKNSETIIIYSDKAKYNSLNYDTNFSENILVKFVDHTINSDNLDLFFKNNIAIISRNVVYKNLGTIMRADKIKIDLVTKNSTIFMDSSLKKVKITNVE
jgi:lipopolysaccharide export system protein LptA